MPLAYRVIFIQLVAFGWNIYLSLQANKQTWLPYFYLAIGVNLPDAAIPVLFWKMNVYLLDNKVRFLECFGRIRSR